MSFPRIASTNASILSGEIASREFDVVGMLINLQELRLTLCNYSDDRSFLNPDLLTNVSLTSLKLMIRASWNGWDSLNVGFRAIGAYWPALSRKMPNLEGEEMDLINMWVDY